MSRYTVWIGLALLSLPACTEVLATSEQAIIGGETASPAEFPSVVALETTPGNWSCTGTLIDKHWVLSAAHCVEGETAARLHIRFDDANVNDTSGGTVVAVAAIHAHPAFVDDKWDNDIALLELATSVTDREPTPMHRAVIAPATSITEVGYGDSNDSGGGGGILRKLVKPTSDCAKTGDPQISGANVLCFDASTGHTSCYGDSGGPAFLTVGGKLVVAGVNSGGTEDSCTTGWDLYTSVAAELDFVDMVLGTQSPDPDPDPDPDPNNPDPGAGCNTSRPGGGLLVVVGLLLARRRRSRRYLP